MKNYKTSRKEHKREFLGPIQLGKEFSDLTPNEWPVRGKLINWTSSDLKKTFVLQKTPLRERKGKLQTVRKYL